MERIGRYEKEHSMKRLLKLAGITAIVNAGPTASENGDVNGWGRAAPARGSLPDHVVSGGHKIGDSVWGSP